MLLQLLQHLLKCLHVLFAFAFSIDENVIEVHYNKNVELFCQDLIDVTLKRDRYVGQSKRHELVHKVAIAGPESRLLFVAFLDPYLMVGIGQIELGEASSPT